MKVWKCDVILASHKKIVKISQVANVWKVKKLNCVTLFSYENEKAVE